MTETCNYNGCSEEAQVKLDKEEETIPACTEHAENLLDGDNGETGDRPVLSNGEEQAAWINTTEQGKTYLSIKIQDGNYVNLFAQTDLIQDALNRQHQVTQENE